MKLDVRNVHAAYQKDLFILKGLDLSVAEGKIVIVIGPNGSGKSTLLKSICGILKPQKGSVWLDRNGDHRYRTRPDHQERNLLTYRRSGPYFRR